MNRAIIVSVLALFVIALTPRVTFAQTGKTATRDWLRTDTRSSSKHTPAGASSGLGRGLAALVLVSVGGFFVWRKTRQTRRKALPDKSHIRVVGGTLVGPKARAVIAQVGGRLILLGVTEQSVRKLAWLDSIDEADTADELESEQRPSHGEQRSPRQLISQRVTETRGRTNAGRSKFSDVLRDAVGMKPRSGSDSALRVAESTHDRVNLSYSKARARDEVPFIDIEGQAAGLVSRLNKTKQ